MRKRLPTTIDRSDKIREKFKINETRYSRSARKNKIYIAVRSMGSKVKGPEDILILIDKISAKKAKQPI